MPIEFKANNTKVLRKTKFLNLMETTYNGKQKWIWATRPAGQKAVMIVPFIYEGGEQKIIMIKEKRIPLGVATGNVWEWGFPAGLIDGDENPVETVKRELTEETGLEVGNVNFISPFLFNSAGMTDESISIAFVDAKGMLTNKNLEESEEIQSYICSRDAAQYIMNNPENNLGAKAWLILYFWTEMRGHISSNRCIDFSY